MSASLNIASAEAAPQQTARRILPSWTREPLLHFMLLGAALFALDHWLVAHTDDPHTIVVGAEVDRDARAMFKSARGQEPSAQQLAALRQAWLDNEVLYREGLALRVDQGDATIRERVIFKALNIVEANLKLPPVDDKTLRSWFEAHRDKYDEPTRFDLEEAVLAGDNSESAVRAFVTELNTGTGSTRAGLRVFKGRPHGNIVQSYGAEFAKALEEASPGEWRALRTLEGWRAMRLDGVVAGKAAVFEPVRNVVLQDWTDATMAELRTAAVRALARKYTVRVQGERS